MFNNKNTAIIILDYNRPDLTNKCLKSIWEFNRLQIILVNSGKTDYNQYCKSIPFIYIKNERGRYFSIGMNEGIKKARELNFEYVILLNNDAIITDNSIKMLIESIENYPNLGMISSNREYSFTSKSNKGQLLTNINEMQFIKPEIKKVDILTGFCLCTKIELLSKIGNYDENFVFTKEDDDLCFRIKAQGYDLAEVLNSIVLHKPSTSTNYNENDSFKFLIFGVIVGYLLLLKKNEISFLKLLINATKDICRTTVKAFIYSKKLYCVLIVMTFLNSSIYVMNKIY